MNKLSLKIISLVEQSQFYVSRITNTTLVYTYFKIGQLIIEEFQDGEVRADYGKNVLRNVSLELSERLGKGYSVDNLENMRKFYLNYNSQFSIIKLLFL